MGNVKTSNIKDIRDWIISIIGILTFIYAPLGGILGYFKIMSFDNIWLWGIWLLGSVCLSVLLINFLLRVKKAEKKTREYIEPMLFLLKYEFDEKNWRGFSNNQLREGFEKNKENYINNKKNEENHILRDYFINKYNMSMKDADTAIEKMRKEYLDPKE